MITLHQFFLDLTNPALAFLPKALLISVLSSFVCAVVGTHVVLRGMAFIGDAVAHAVFPGIAIAFALGGSVLLGGAVAGTAIALLIAVFSQRRRVKEDTLIGIFYAAAFALGLVIISRIDGYTASLTSFLFGSITGVPDSDLLLVFGVGSLVVAILLLLGKELVTVALDRESARAQGLPVFLLDIVMYVAVTAAVVISVRTIGNILVLALLITPPATARLFTDRLDRMMLLSALFGCLGSVGGVYFSWAWNFPTGATIVLTTTAMFLFSWLISPKVGVLRMPSRRPHASTSALEGN
ncbi:anchored repeat-type ABC transporter permease subunit [Corynebacterium epidermidicanis]|uniref:Anchored repeat-type ABC transporter, permease subunit n=1 Tax=Corynebacterium epidermidicanis TaxID=1050174 RepID=A0A0G3GSI8_9CORY|nr:anchored repeat-type ABC transporter permease subunit [Corynebacterium epidermidicanis]AKK04099.1 anchored repeat-type ABC transporter, permease subunit [Corynebacterium epidermidicanis]